MHYLVSKRKGIFWERGRQLKPSGRFNIYKKNILDKSYQGLREADVFNDTDCFTFNSWFCWLKQTL